MITDRQRRIYDAWTAIEEGDPDISTERLMSMTAEQCGCGIEDVCAALFLVGTEKGTIREGTDAT